jgi:hypothetical protein
MSDEKSRTLKKARAMLDDRLAAIEALQDARAEEARREEALKASQRVTAQAWATATARGWPESDLRQLGFKRPAVRAPGRPRRSKTAPAAPKESADTSTAPSSAARPGQAPSAATGALTG